MSEDIVEYQPRGTCSRLMRVKIKDGIVEDALIMGGCQGNLSGIRALIRGMKIQDVIDRLKGIDCGGKGTSCPDQLATCLAEYKRQKES